MPPRKKTKNATFPVEAHVHKKDKRENIPTAELQDFVREDEAKPKKILYPRDPSFDPQTGKLVFQIIGAVAEFEKDIIRERVRAGLENARQKGKRLGRPEINNEILQKARVLRKQGLSFRTIEKQLSVDEGTIRKRITTLA